MNRRDCLKALAVLAGGCATTSTPLAIAPTRYMIGGDDISTFAEFSQLYQGRHLPVNKDTVTILYPGSGFDLSPLEIGFHLLYQSRVKETHFIYTEIGEYEQELPTWHQGLADLDQKLKSGLQELVNTGMATSLRAELKKSEWVRNDILNSRVLEYELDVPVRKEKKKIKVTLGYNTFEHRAEPTPDEQQSLPSQILSEARQSYWPSPVQPKKIYPTYFLQEQFDAADILLSKQCGDFGLLQFDYLRAWRKTKLRKQRVLLTEHAQDLMSLQEGLKGYTTEVYFLENNRYGYCAGYEQSCKVGILSVQPAADF